MFLRGAMRIAAPGEKKSMARKGQRDNLPVVGDAFEDDRKEGVVRHG